MRADPYDIAIIGAGSGGMSAAHRARHAGLSVVMFDGGRAGGTCVNRGCVPKKLLVHASRQGDAVRESAALGWGTGEVAFDWPALRDGVRSYVDSLAASKRDELISAGVTFIDEEALLLAPDRVRSSSGREFAAEHVIIATGSRPVRPDIPGAGRAFISDDLFGLQRLPERLAMIGGGYIAVEFACILTRFGVDVTIFEESGAILGGFERGGVEAIRNAMEADGIAVHLGAGVKAIAGEANVFELELESGARHGAFDAAALVVGRAPNTEGLGVWELSIELDGAGQIAVDDHGRSSVAGVYAIGDVARQPQLTPVATADGRNVIDGILGRAFEPLDPDLIPTAVFATPELGSVGLTEDQARERGLAVDVRRTVFSPLTDALRDDPPEASVKLVIESGGGVVLGYHAMGAHAAEGAQIMAAALRAGVTADRLGGTTTLHPTSAEEIVILARGGG